MVMTLNKVIEHMESGCCRDTLVDELRRLRDADEAIAAGDAILMNEQAQLLRRCRAALDGLLAKKPMFGSLEWALGHERNSLGNLRAELYDYRSDAVP